MKNGDFFSQKSPPRKTLRGAHVALQQRTILRVSKSNVSITHFTEIIHLHGAWDTPFAEDKTRVWDMNVQKILNTTRKITLNMVGLFKDANCHARTPLTSILKQNLFDLAHLACFLDFFRAN